jgi:hypothetical protein
LLQVVNLVLQIVERIPLRMRNACTCQKYKTRSERPFAKSNHGLSLAVVVLLLLGVARSAAD